MAEHVFLTGKKHIGKSTVLKKILQGYQGRIGGFFTVRTREFLKEAYSVHLFCPGDPPIPDEKNLLFVCGKPQADTRERFDRLGTQALSRTWGCSVILMDELGSHEASAVLFRKAVLQFLEGDIPILGVLQAPGEGSWPEVAGHPKVQVVEITEENRDQEELIAGIRARLLL